MCSWSRWPRSSHSLLCRGRGLGEEEVSAASESGGPGSQPGSHACCCDRLSKPHLLIWYKGAKPLELRSGCVGDLWLLGTFPEMGPGTS